MIIEIQAIVWWKLIKIGKKTDSVYQQAKPALLRDVSASKQMSDRKTRYQLRVLESHIYHKLLF